MDNAAAARHALPLEPIMDTARKEAGAGDFRDLSFVPALKQVLEIPGRLNFSADGLQTFQGNLVRALVNRLRYEADVAAHPEILEEDVSDPIVIIGLPRSGTTKLQRILSADPTVQKTHAWKMFNPAPLPGEKYGDPAPRIAWAQAMTSAVATINPDFNRIHEYEALEADETCYIPLANFDYPLQWVPTSCGTYLKWVRTVDRTSPISWLKRMLQYLQWQDGGRRGPWLTKNPAHTGEIAEVLQVFPNATFIMAERDIPITMASNIQMMWEIQRNSFVNLDPHVHGRGMLEYWSHELHRYLEQRRALGDRAKVVEASYRQILADPIGVARDAWKLHGLPWTKAGEDAMRGWERDNPAHKFGKFKYDLADFGLTAADVEKAFGDIAERWRGL